MAKATMANRALPTSAERAVSALGRDIATARKRRRMTQRLMADKMMVNVETVQRLEHGDPSVGIGIVATALWVLGLSRRLEDLIAPDTDAVGQSEEIRRLPKAIRVRRPAPELDF